MAAKGLVGVDRAETVVATVRKPSAVTYGQTATRPAMIAAQSTSDNVATIAKLVSLRTRFG